MRAYCISGLVSGSTFSQYFWEGQIRGPFGSGFRTLYHFLIPAWTSIFFGFVSDFFFTDEDLWVQIPLKRYLTFVVLGL